MYDIWYDYIKPKYQSNVKSLWILTALLFRLKLKIFTKIFQVMLKYCLTHQILAKMIIDLFQEVRTRN